ncbi:murein hydrolase activator EnvC family protein [Ureibacillus thermosphaericus]|uniref:murein hydrolase activator EnvC family protein n=1 Tax=Ureibacillus thermosphaericus TaxID=51173 RepID=UPI0030C9A6D0
MGNFAKHHFKLFAALVAVLLFIQIPVTYAANLSDLKNKQSQVEQQKKQLNAQIHQKSNELKSNQTKQEQLLAQIDQLVNQISKTNEEIKQVENEIGQANEKIEALEEEIEELQKKIDERNALLEERARALQANGSVTFLDVLLGSNSFVDFIDRFSAVNTLIEADRQIIRDQKNDQQKLEEQKLVLENTKRKLEEQQSKLENLKASLTSQKQEKNRLIDELEKEQQKLLNEKKLLEKQYSEYLEISKELQEQIAEIQRQQLSKAQSAGNLPVSDSGFMKPTNGVLTSGYGWRNLGYGPDFHYGIDLANSAGTPIVASADGVVTYASSLSTYGNVVMITHNINGEIYTTLYAHLRSFNVSVGDVVKQGQQIAEMGSTGRSTGPHLHFEVHIGTWRGQTAGVQNPLRYISL